MISFLAYTKSKNELTLLKQTVTHISSVLNLSLIHIYMYNIIWESLYVDRKLFTEYYENFCKSYMRSINSGKKKGEVRDIDSEVLAYMLMGISNFVGLKYGMFEKSGVDFDRITDEVMKVLEGGMFTGDLSQLREVDTEQKKNMDFRVEVDFDFLGEEDPSAAKE